MSDPKTTEVESQTSHGDRVPDHEQFVALRENWRRSMGEDSSLRQQAVDLQLAADAHRYTYTWEWAGAPIIRLPDDIVVLQELYWSYKPQRVVETGVARGGSVLLSSSLMRMCGLEPAVLGIDHKIYPHTTHLLEDHPLAGGIALVEADSTSDETRARVEQFIAGSERVVLILDSNHTHQHVLAELSLLAPLLPSGSYILVADTLIEEYPDGHFSDRPWDRGDNPLTAIDQFLREHPEFTRADEWGRRALTSEFRDGIVRRLGRDGASS